MSYLGRRLGGDIKQKTAVLALTLLASVSVQSQSAFANNEPPIHGSVRSLYVHHAGDGTQIDDVNEVTLFSAASSSRRRTDQPMTSFTSAVYSDDNSATVPTWLQHLPFAIAGIASAYAPSSDVSMASYRGNAPQRYKPFSGLQKRTASFGPVEAYGWTAFAGGGHWRLYTFPSTMKAKHRFDEAWKMYYGLQFDAMRLVGLGPSDKDFFAVAEIKSGFDDPTQGPQPVYAARLLIGYNW